MLNTVTENRPTENRLTENHRPMHLTSRSNPPESKEMLLSRAVEALQDSFIVTDTVGRVKYVNQSTERLFRLVPLAPTNYYISALFTDELALNVVIRRAILSAWQGEVTAKKSTGETFITAITASGVRDESGKVIGISFVVRDITSQKQRELELERSNKLKSDFLAHMSHELRTPLTSILGFSSVLEKQIFGKLNLKQGQYIGQIHRSGQHLLNLINDILDLSKIEAGQMELEIEPTDLRDVCESAIELVSEQARMRDITIDQTALKELQLPADELRLRQVLINLLTNAIKFSEDGGKIGVRTEKIDNMISLCVWDEGIGIPQNQQNRLFQPFQQIPSRHSQNVRSQGKRSNIGTGLGLALSRRLVELHQGYITVESIEAEGSKFTVHLPIAA
ncbi:PAS domain-containing sensor histidine kinase [filamentous cyanobacterium LEGE 11480]|uniref:histidine kinase n=1 Tax=Romeriopsis navalis LEGE 11480 TaxID=2777977 RepID=A0A928Z291_9CYAN|nr:PAS domain-containing sensor histidine kinase [Romeriopsis navalis]MBE9028787.1 PAS domain-containing sensor histidine kinase [Romeriopsis navalis LEGE 11480]